MAMIRLSNLPLLQALDRAGKIAYVEKKIAERMAHLLNECGHFSTKLN